ncbi:MAG: kelch repeat-containing protein [Elusimicrobiota bacterium]
MKHAMLNLRKLIFPALVWLLGTSLLGAGTCQIQDTDADFGAGDPEYHDQTTVRYTGSPAQVELLFKWIPVTSGMYPDARQFSPLEYLPDANCILLFGGYDSGRSPKDFNDTWLFNTSINSWSYKVFSSSSVPSVRHGHGISRMNGSKAVLFGGYDMDLNEYKKDTWVYDAAQNRWDEVLCSTYPPKRAFSAMCRTAGEIVLFGGTDGTNRYSDTWVFDVNAQTWSYRATAGNPSGRYSSSYAYNKSDGKMYLFGGQDPALKQDLWKYDSAANTWALVAAGGGPSARSDSGMFYDPWNDCLAVFGGDDGNRKDDIYYYKTAWNEGFPENTPSTRSGHGLIFISTYSAFLFGGRDNAGAYLQDSHFLLFHSTGSFTIPLDVPFSTSLDWKSISFNPSGQKTGTNIKLQVASRAEGSSWDSFRGWDGNTNSFYEFGVGQSTAAPLWMGHMNRRFLRYRYFLASTLFPNSPAIDSVIVSFNRAAPAPVLLNPLHEGSTNCVFPAFTWNNASDADGDALIYEFQADDDPNFGSPLISTAGIPSGSGVTTSTAPAVPLQHGTWYWRARANDGLTSLQWSGAYTLFVDTIAPGRVISLSAVTGLGNGEIILSWTAPGDNDYSFIITTGSYEVKFATYGPIDETLYALISESRRQTPVSMSPGTSYSAVITGLNDGTTYYFAMKISDKAGNVSLVSLASPAAYTNAAPEVILSTPVGGEYWTGTRDIVWNSYDPNWYDTRTFRIYASSDSGANYSINVTTYALSHGTTFYRWDTRRVSNGVEYRVKVEATDNRGLKGSAASPGDFSVFNPNQKPSVTVIYPNGGETISNTATFTWTIYDYNGADTHVSEIYISADGGNTYSWYFQTAGASYTLNTKELSNGPFYRVKVSVTDSGSPPENDIDASDADFRIDNQNLKPNMFSLVYPPDGSSRSILDINLSWENGGDPNPEDALSYRLVYSTSADLSCPAVVSGLKTNSYKIAPSALTADKAYYWKVTAIDPLGLETGCAKAFSVYALSRFKTESTDSKIQAEITEGLPAEGFLDIEILDSRASQAMRDADQDSIIDRSILKISDVSYKISVCGINRNELQAQNPILSVKAAYDDADNDGYFDGTLVKAESIRCAMLNEIKCKWEFPDAQQTLDKTQKRISFSLQKLGSITLLGAITPLSMISGVVNYPNPFAAGRQSTRIRYTLTESSDVTLKVYTLMGDLVWQKNIPAGTEGAQGQPAGRTNEVFWDGKNGSQQVSANGMYILEIKSGSERQLRKIGIVK